MKTIRLLLILSVLILASGCAYLRVDPWYVAFRSDIITTPEEEAEILKKASAGWTADGRIRVLYLAGSPYERGYQHGVLLRKEIQDNLGYFYKQASKRFHTAELFAEGYERMRPFISQDYIDEMHGLAHGAKLPLHVVQHIHALPEISEWGGKKRLKEIMKQMMSGELGTSCSNLSAADSSSIDGKMYTVRILDWGLHRISKLHQFPLIAVHKPDRGNAYANIGWIGFIGAISGMNDQGITLGEMGYGSPENETLRGNPMPFLLRDILAYANNLEDVRRIIKTSPGTNSYVYLMSDGKNNEAELYVRDRERFLVFKTGEEIKDRNETLIGIKDTVYGGHYGDRMQDQLSKHHGKINPELLMNEIIPQLAMRSNFQNVIYSPNDLTFWVNNAKSPKERAAEQPYSFFDLAQALSEF